MTRSVLLPLALVLSSCRPAPTPRRLVVEIRDMAFSPSRLEVAVGDTVVWVDHDVVPHTATPDSGAGWDSGPILAGGSGTYVVQSTGTIGYHCRFHPVMQGTLIAGPQR